MILLFGASFTYLNITTTINFENIRLDPNINKIAIGDSRIRGTINDTLLGNTKNASLYSEGFVYSYHKIKTLTKNNQIDTIFLGVGYHSFSDYYDEYIDNPFVLRRYFYVIPMKLQFEFLKKIENPVNFIMKSILTELRVLITNSEIDYWIGNYDNYSTDATVDDNSIKSRIQFQYFHDDERIRDFSKSNIHYFNKIAKYCRESNISLIILNPPLHSNYKEKVPKKFMDKFYSIINENAVKLIEFDGLFLENDHFLPDGDHVSFNGSFLTTKYLIEAIEQERVMEHMR